MWDHKPTMDEWFDKDLPDSIRQGQRLTTMTSGQARFPIAPSIYKFSPHGEAGTMASELIPHMAGKVDEIALVNRCTPKRSTTIPAITYICTGDQLPGKASLGAWLSYGLGTENENLPAFMVMTASWTGRKQAQALYNRLWGSGFLPSKYQGVALAQQRRQGAVSFQPRGHRSGCRRRMLDSLARLNESTAEQIGDPETNARIAQYEMAFRMQTSVPDLADISDEPQHVLDLYGPDVTKPGTFANCCLMARRMAERGVRFTQIFHRGWDQHGTLPKDLPNQCRDVDQPSAGLLTDLRQRGMLDDTLVVWGGEFGRTDLLPRAADQDELWSRPSSQVLYDLDGRRRYPGRRGARRNRRVQLQHRPRPGPHSRPERHDPALDGNRPPAVHVSIQGTRSAAHGCSTCRVVSEILS